MIKIKKCNFGKHCKVFYSIFLLAVFLFNAIAFSNQEDISGDHIAVLDMDMMILPGTQGYLDKSLQRAKEQGAKLVILKLDTPGGMLQTSNEMTQAMLASELPIVVYVNPSGATATSAGVFITMAGHIAAMSPGTTIGAAHPVSGNGEDIKGDMRQKAENMTIAMVKSISKERGRNAEWAEKSVKESASITEGEAVELGVVDFVAKDIKDLISKLEGREVKLKEQQIVLKNLSTLEVINYEIGFQDKFTNVIANPSVAALLWLGATTGLSIEMYNPGLILPGVVGVICLVLALTVMQIIPITQIGVIFLVLGAVMFLAEFFIPSGILGIGGLISIVFGAIYLVDTIQAPGLEVNYYLLLPFAALAGLILLIVSSLLYKAKKTKVVTGNKGLVGLTATVDESLFNHYKLLINGELWKVTFDGEVDQFHNGDLVKVTEVLENLTLKIKKI